MFGSVYNFNIYTVTVVFVVLAPMITCMLIWFTFDKEKWCGVNYNHLQNQYKAPKDHLKNNSNPWRDTEDKQGHRVLQYQNYTVQALLRLIQLRLNGSLGPKTKKRATSWFPFFWKGKILHPRARLMAKKQFSPLLPAQVPVEACGIKVGHKSVHLFHGDIMCTMTM